jgi:phospholipase C
MSENNSPLQSPLSRRRLLQTSALAATGLAAYLPAGLREAIANADTSTPFDPSKVKHIVLLMQENRSFDHYFGAMSGVRGFSDPHAIKQANGRSIFQQPDPANPAGYLLPYHVDATHASAALPSLSHQWQIQHLSWNNGKMDGWMRAHTAADAASGSPYVMGYYNGNDIPFHWALANAFTICDNYFCSVLGPTHPNRYMWMTGTVDPNAAAGGPALDNNATAGTYTWTTTAERLQAAGISWKCYQQSDNYGTNVLENFKQIRNADKTVPFGLYQNAFGVSTLFGSTNGQGAATDPTQAFEQDCANGTLPTVSWIFPTSVASEHPSYLPAAGAQFVASKINAVAANPDLWNSTVFILNYDENDGFFDHVPPPTPPAGTANEFVTHNSPGGTPGGGLPVGAGFRVPAIIISPWTVGGYVATDAFDHTSCLQFIERVTGITETNISAWRRSTFGDFTSAFQGSATATPPAVPGSSPSATAAALATQQANSANPLPAIPGRTQTTPAQDPGSRPTIP